MPVCRICGDNLYQYYVVIGPEFECLSCFRWNVRFEFKIENEKKVEEISQKGKHP